MNWISLLISLIIFSVVIYFIVKIHKRQYAKLENKKKLRIICLVLLYIASVNYGVGVIGNIISLANGGFAQQETFWEGSVKPGVYNVSWRYTSAYGTNANKETVEIALFENQEFEIRCKTECGITEIYHTSYTTMDGRIQKKKEIYNGVEKVWFYLEGVDSDNRSTSYSILPSGAFYTGGSRWQYLATDSPKGWIR